ncbi:von Willebrand factor, partial [Clupea harengus]|uniref:von Willebrand factor n=1 Tax=Clupea harengus TaxID=7950 RepID=A0A6P8F9P4_CLUHA
VLLRWRGINWRGWSRGTLVILFHFAACVSVCAGETGRCSAFGWQHIHSFDGVLYEFSGDCSYMLAGDCHKRAFTILGDFSNGKRKGVTLFLGEFFELRLSVDGTLSRGAERLHLPYASSSVFAGRELGGVRMWSEEFGFSVRIDGDKNIDITLSKRHGNRTCGLCGNYNSLPDDDYTSREGFLTDDPYDFANSWMMNGAEPCKRVAPPSETCNLTGDAAKEVMSQCEVFRSSAVFLHCAHVLDPAAFQSVCERSVCHCGGRKECVCATLQEYARACAHHGITLHGWNEHSSCAPKCPVGMEYSVCAQSCSTTCQSLNIPEVCQEECVDGCDCPVGKVLDGERCVDVSQCSCVHTGKRYPPGSSISQNCNTCVCQHGSWQCTNEGCPGECFVTGQSHFKTFDDKFYTFSGTCQYLLAKDCSDSVFSAVIETVQCADEQDAVCTRSVSLRFHQMANQTIRLRHGGVVSVDGMDVQTPLINGDLRVQRTVQTAVRLSYRDDLSLDWDGRGRVVLRLGPAFAGKTCGLCGNYNGNQGDDFLTPGGLVEGRVEGFGNAWKTHPECDNLHHQHTDPCSLNPKRVLFAEESCSILLSPKFEACHYEVNPAPFVKNCRFDLCACADGHECLCSAVSSYAAACAARGVLIHWRGNGYCEMECSGKQQYELCGSVCNQSCRSLSLPEGECVSVCEEGCFCPSGLFLSDAGECVSREDCSCYYDGEIYEPNDVFSDHHSTCYCENGSMRCTARDHEGATLTDLFFDEFSPSRERRSASCPPPLEKLVCESPRNQGIECARTCQNMDLECVSQGCTSGCVCPPGKVRHRKDCISPDQCPCFHNNRAYALGESVKMDCNTCVCRGRRWDCTQNVCDGVCRTVGESHYITYDGLKYTFPGPCQYVLTQDYCNGLDGSFRVLVENSACGVVGHRCSKSVTVFYKGGVISMDHGEVRMKRPVLSGVRVELVRSGLYYIILLGSDISITWDRATRLDVRITGQYRGKVCGLCGNFDGVQNNDLLSSNQQMEVEPADFGNSWKTQPRCADATPLPSQCSSDMVKLVTVEQSCRVLTSSLFKECNSVVDPEPYWEICTHDSCACPSVGDCVCFCDAIAAYAHTCAQSGVVVHWRSNDLCPLSCEDLNKGSECQWKYSACAEACPLSCQHPEPLHCPQVCVEGCHATCPPGQVLDEVSLQCVNPEKCEVCMHEGERVSHGKHIILNHDNPELCKICRCENNTLTCASCPPTGLPTTTLSPTTLFTTPAPLLFSTAMPEDACDRAMDLAFLVDGSTQLSEEDFGVVKTFILGVVERFRMGSAHTRATMLLFHSGVKSYDMQVQKWIFRKMVRDMRYTGGETAFIDEALKYLSVYIYDKNKREHAGRVAILLTASANPRPMRTTQRLLRKKDITVLTVALGPEVDMAQVNDITKATPSSRAYVLSSAAELQDQGPVITDYLCTLGLDPETPKPKATPGKPQPQPQPQPLPTQAQPLPTRGQTQPTLFPQPTTTPESSAILAPDFVTTSPVRSATGPTLGAPGPGGQSPVDVVFVLEGSDAVGEEGFNRTRDSLVEVVSTLVEEEELITITIIQYSEVVTVEIRSMEIRNRWLLLERMRQIRWAGGAKTNTGHAIRSLYETVSTQRPSHMPDQLVFLVTQNPPTDKIERPPSSAHTQVFPVLIGPKVREVELEHLSFPQKPIVFQKPEDLSSLRPLLLNLTHGIRRPLLPTLPPLPPLPTLPPSVPCTKPMDVQFLLRASEGHFEDLKTFVRAFIQNTDIGPNTTQVSVQLYGEKVVEEISWGDKQSPEDLLTRLDSIHTTPSTTARLGSALRSAVRTAVSSASGGRVGVPKVVVMVVTDRSVDSVQEAASEALTAGVAVFPVGVGAEFDHNELSTLAGAHTPTNAIQLSSTDDLIAMATLGHTFYDKLCRAGPPGVCVDDEGNQRKPGESWLQADGCHTLLCNPGGAVTLQSHRVNCERMEPPACSGNIKPVKVPEACGCSWHCPCMCIGSSSNHIVPFGGAALKLEGFCSYSLIHLGGAEIILHTTPCEALSNHICMKSMELRGGGATVVLQDDMKVTVDGVVTPVPLRVGGLEVTQFGAMLHHLRASELGLTITFTPHSNEFTITRDIAMTTNITTGICGSCGNDQLLLSDGSATSDPERYLRSWVVGECAPTPSDMCVPGVAKRCAALKEAAFGACHGLVPPEPYLALCEETACHPRDVCDLVSAYSSVCRQQGVCVDWRSPDLCPMSCPTTMRYQPCRTGCVEDCERGPGEPSNMVELGDGMTAGGGPQCSNTPTEGCFCPEGMVQRGDECVRREACKECVDQNGHTHPYLQSWSPDDNPCLMCVCLDQKQINCTVLPCTHSKAPVCEPCEVVREKKSSCCPEYECVCDEETCVRPQPPRCENGQSLSLTNPGECMPIYECVCKKEECSLMTAPPCPTHRRPTVTKTECCDVTECVCDCHNSTKTCPPGHITTATTNECDCTEVSCQPDKVCVVEGVVYQVGRQWEDGCKTCSCTDRREETTGLHVTQCQERECTNDICPMGSSFSQAKGECCGKCVKTSCLAESPQGGSIKEVGEQWQNDATGCVLSECVRVNQEVFIAHTNVSCHMMDTPTCPLGTELQCNTVDHCCPVCQCVSLDVCVMNHTIIGAGERVMVDVCTHCECSMVEGLIRKTRLSCRKITCSPCPEGYTMDPVADSCCGRCVASACTIRRPDGELISLKANSSREDGCVLHSCGVNREGDLVLETRITTCPPFDRQQCLDEGGKITQIGNSCCEMCTEPECRRTVGVLNFIRVQDCQSEEKIELHYCEGKCRSRSMYSLEKHAVEPECVCCSSTGTEPVSVSLRCANGTHTHTQLLSVTGCECQAHACPAEH